MKKIIKKRTENEIDTIFMKITMIVLFILIVLSAILLIKRVYGGA